MKPFVPNIQYYEPEPEPAVNTFFTENYQNTQGSAPDITPTPDGFGGSEELLTDANDFFSRGARPNPGSEDYKDLMYFTEPNLDVGVLVEDCVSAESCYNAGFTGIALLGTSMHESRIKDLMPFKEIVIALDKDANMKALKIKKMLDPYMNCRVVFLPDDLKYFSPGVVQAIITKPPAYCPSL